MSIAFSQASYAQDKTAASDAKNATDGQSAQAGSQSLPQQIRNKLKDQGFTDVQVVPGSFLVSAKDKDGDPVTMILGPHSMTVFTMVSSDDSGRQQTSGSEKGSSK
ncbi:hypothetical protein [Bradyrhizobium sp. USDA 10063]